MASSKSIFNKVLLVLVLACSTSRGAERFVVVLSDDANTRGDWVGVYGRYAHILCAMRSPSSLKGGPGWPIKFDVTTPKPDDPARAWLSYRPSRGDGRVLWHPVEKRRIASSWDDHGEVYKLGAGPDLHVHLSVPAGLFMLSLYFFEIDWIQYRDYDINVFCEDGGKPVLAAKTVVHDFFDGIYKRFAVSGPTRLRIVIKRKISPNAVLSGVFLDPIGADRETLFTDLLPASLTPPSADVSALAAAATARLRTASADGAPPTSLAAYFRAESDLACALRSVQRRNPKRYYSTLMRHWIGMRRRARAAEAKAVDEQAEINAYLLVTESSYGLYDFNSGRAALRSTLLAMKRLGDKGAERAHMLANMEMIAKSLLADGRSADARTPCRIWSLACVEWLDKSEAAKRLEPMAKEAMTSNIGLSMVEAYKRLVKRYASPPFEVLLALANLYYTSDKPAQAIPIYLAAIQRMPAGSQKKWTLIALLSCHLERGSVNEALEVLRRLQKEYPGCPERLEAQLRIADHFLSIGKLTEAEQWLRRTAAQPDAGPYRELLSSYFKEIEKRRKRKPAAARQ